VSYTPQVGDRVHLYHWPKDYTAEVLFVGDRQVFLRDIGGQEDSFYINLDWIKVETPSPLPERWINLYERCSVTHVSRRDASNGADDKRIAVIHIWTDKHGVDHAEIERT